MTSITKHVLNSTFFFNRQGNDLCPQELAFQAARRKKMKKAFAKFIGVKESEIHENDIPVVALAGRCVSEI